MAAFVPAADLSIGEPLRHPGPQPREREARTGLHPPKRHGERGALRASY